VRGNNRSNATLDRQGLVWINPLETDTSRNCFLAKKVGVIKKESGSLMFTGLKIPRDYDIFWRTKE